MAASNDKAMAQPGFATEILPIRGVRLATAASGLRYRRRDDLALIEIAPGSTFACAYTRNKFCAAPVTVARRHQASHTPRYLIVNAGNANAGTGKAGERSALAVCAAVAVEGACRPEEVLPYSTGVIGAQLDAQTLGDCAPDLLKNLADDAWPAAASAILTTDTRAKVRSVVVDAGSRQFTATGMTKGSGMIRPNMATMLAYVATDAAVAAPLLQQMVISLADDSFNRITVDGDTSTNDAFAIIATAAAGNQILTSPDDPDYDALYAALQLLTVELAKDIVRDGEGATKFVTIKVTGGRDEDACRCVAETVAHSPLVKTALFASDPNWGRILAAVGRAPIASLELDQVDIDIGTAAIVRGGEPWPDYNEQTVAALMREAEIDITIRIGSGGSEAVMWTCDLSYDYVKINAEYRS